MPPWEASEVELEMTLVVAVQLTLPDSKPGLARSCCTVPEVTVQESTTLWVFPPPVPVIVML